MSLPDIAHAARRAARRLWARWPAGASRRCCLCGSAVRAFLPYRDGLASLPAVAVEADIIGSDVENFECPACRCHDRERHLVLYLRATGVLSAMKGARCTSRPSGTCSGSSPQRARRSTCGPISTRGSPA